jgi:hypothetical protein
MGRFQPRLSYANVMSTLAVFLALAGGVAYALDRNSVKSKHIKDGQVKLADAQKSAFGRGTVFGAVTNLSGGVGATNYFPSGLNVGASARAAIAPVKLRLRDFRVELASVLTGGTRTFELGQFDPDGSGPLRKGLSCEISAGEASCRAKGPSPRFSAGGAIHLKDVHANPVGGAHAAFSWRAALP